MAGAPPPAADVGGPDKLRWWLKRAYPHTRVPVPGTLSRWLARAGLTPRNQRSSPPGPQVAASAPLAVRRTNDLGTLDFKGKFHTAEGGRIETLTVRDAVSRCALALRDDMLTGKR